MHLKPSAPPLSLYEELIDYNCEIGCDVEFLVGSHPDQYIRIPVHSQKLLEFPIFKAMLSDRYANAGVEAGPEGISRGEVRLRQIPVWDVDGKAFDNLMRFVYKKPLNLHLQTLEMVIETLKAAHKYLFPGLVRACVKQMSNLICGQSVLWIYASVLYLCNNLDNLEELTKLESQRPMPKRRKLSACSILEKDGKSLSSQDDDFSAGLEIKKLCVWLLGQTLTFIDVHAAHVLQSEELERLDEPYLNFLLKRDSLDVSESVVFSALVRWAENQCKHRHLPLTSHSKRLVLHDLIYLVRFFHMTDLEFRSGPEDSGLLKPEENEVIKNMILYGRPGFLHRCLSSQPELHGLCVHWHQIGKARLPRLNRKKSGDALETGSMAKKRKWSSFKMPGGSRKNSLRLKKVGGIVKNFCLPCTDNANPGKRRHSDSKVQYGNGQTVSSHQNNLTMADDDNRQEKVKVGRRESTLSKAIYVTVNIFAFFFD